MVAQGLAGAEKTNKFERMYLELRSSRMEHIYERCPTGVKIALFLLDYESTGSVDIEDIETHLLVETRDPINGNVKKEMREALSYLERNGIVYHGGLRTITLTGTGTAAAEYFKILKSKPTGSIQLSKIVEKGYRPPAIASEF
ncbi:Uncharacterised protein [uncultured archaeon]|nr:Uncharacterised protein [uncultured archaeon]